MTPVVLSRTDRVRGGLLGLLIGDAIGVPYEFRSAAELAAIDPTRFALPYRPEAGVRRAHPAAPAGAWSDDGATALALWDSLHRAHGWDPNDFAAALLAWWNRGDYAAQRVVFDIGNQTRSALHRLNRGIAPLDAGPSSAHENGNGSLMRVLPLALWHTGSDPDLIRIAHEQSRLTHGHPRSQVCCALLCLIARSLLAGAAPSEALEAAVATAHSTDDPIVLKELDSILEHGRTTPPTGSGYVVDCFWSALHALHGATYEEVIRRAIVLGPDTDTTAAVAGGLAGVRFGVDGIPLAWRSALASDPALDRALGRLESFSSSSPPVRRR